jgi:hypothetical protein
MTRANDHDAILIASLRCDEDEGCNQVAGLKEIENNGRTNSVQTEERANREEPQTHEHENEGSNLSQTEEEKAIENNDVHALERALIEDGLEEYIRAFEEGMNEVVEPEDEGCEDEPMHVANPYKMTNVDCINPQVNQSFEREEQAVLTGSNADVIGEVRNLFISSLQISEVLTSSKEDKEIKVFEGQYKWEVDKHGN